MCILCTFSLLLPVDTSQHSIISQYVSSKVARSLFPRSQGSAIDHVLNHSKPFIDFPVTIPPVLDESGYFVGKVIIDLAEFGEDQARESPEILTVNNSVRNKSTKRAMRARSAEDLIDIIDSKISQIPLLVDALPAPGPDDLNLADDFLQIHQALKPPPKKEIPVQVLIVTNRRSGSSFMGQILNQNPKVFFNFEPLKLLEKKPGVYANQSAFLNLLLKCKFKQMPFMMEFYNKERLHRSGSLALTSPPLCTLSTPVNSSNVRQCDKLHPSFTASVCARYSHVAAKLIRVYNISSLQELLMAENLNVKILHLVRDPRGVLLSRSKAEKRNLEVGKSLDQEAGYLCRRMKSNVDFGNSHPQWLNKRYKRVRYEDVAYEPERWAKEIYKFAGLGSVPSEVLSWIRTNTQGSLRSIDSYSTSRNSKQTAEAWRYNITLPVAERISHICRDVMSQLNYKQVNNLEMLHDMTQSLVKL